MSNTIGVLCLLILFVYLCTNVAANESSGHSERFSMIEIQWSHVAAAYTVSIWILIASAAKILFHLNKKFGDAFPDSACLVVVGLILGYVLIKLNVQKDVLNLDATSFFLYLLPPIMFDAGYFMPNRQLFDNIDSVMLFAFLGTIMNCTAISSTLYVCSLYNLFSVEFSIYEILLFGALISAVDPVAVLSVFEELKVNDFLFINVFGEALFNDGVTVVLYVMFKKFTDIGEDNLIAIDFIAAGGSFFVIAIGGVFIGLVYAILVSLITKYTDRVRVLAPVFIFVFPYLAYLTAEMFTVSSILAIVCCGIAMKQYVKANITHEAMCSVKYFTRMLALCSETVIFMFLGLSCVSFDHKFDAWFIGITIASCTVYRTLFVIIQCAFLNRCRKQQFTVKDQFIISYSGLRGAIAFGLAVSIPSTIAARNMFVTTTIAVVFFTVLIQGVTVKPILVWLNVETKEEREIKLVEDLYNNYFDYTISGIEDIAGQKGMNSLRAKYERFNTEFIKPTLIKEYRKGPLDTDHIVRACMKVAMQDASEWVEAIKKAKKGKHDPIQLKKETDTTQTALYAMLNQLLDQKMNELRDSIIKGGSIPMITQGDDIADDYLSRRNYASVGSGLNDNVTRRCNSTEFRRKSEVLGPPRKKSYPNLTTKIHPDPPKKPDDMV